MDLWPGACEDLLRIARDGCPTRFIGESYPVLEEFLYNNIDTALVSSLIAENSFSTLKRVKVPGAHPETTDRILAWLMSDRVTRERRKRFGFKTKSGTAQKFPKHLQTQRQWLSWLVSMKVHPSLPLPPSLPIHDPTPISPASHPVMPALLSHCDHPKPTPQQEEATRCDNMDGIPSDSHFRSQRNKNRKVVDG